MDTTDLVVGAPVRALSIGFGMEPDDYVWPVHDVQDRFIYKADFSRWLQLAAADLVGVSITQSPDSALSVILLTPTTTPHAVLLQISGGTADTTALIGIKLQLSTGQSAEFVLSLPIVARGAGLVPI